MLTRSVAAVKRGEGNDEGGGGGYRCGSSAVALLGALSNPG